jgi:glycosyltransferase involved in cell wall biosynthesis
MRICFYAPFKPLGHVHPSGDLVIATGIFDYLIKCGHHVQTISDFRARWIYWKPWLWPRIIAERKKAARLLNAHPVDLWFTYHSYYKAPDLLGPYIARHTHTPYVIFQGIYATKRRKRLKTRAGFILNQKALRAAGHVFTNKRVDLINLKRLLAPRQISYVAPGIYPDEFSFDADARSQLRKTWQVGKDPVILSAAMFRPGVKVKGLRGVIRACGDLFRHGHRFQLVIAGDGKERAALQHLSDQLLPGRVRFLGKLSRNMMARFYSAGDLFVFPGFGESLGMVFLEAQSCGLPVVAYANSGTPEVMHDQRTGFLVPVNDDALFTKTIQKLLEVKDLRRQMGKAAAQYVRQYHNLDINYRKMEGVLVKTARKRPAQESGGAHG